MAEIGELKVWLSQSFGEEIVEVLADDQGAKDENAAPRRKRR
jgi:hypothetical protein